MSLKNRLGTFCLLAGIFFLFIFATSVFSASGEYELVPLFAGAALVFIGWRWRTSKGGGPVGPPQAAGAGAGPPPGAKKQGPPGKPGGKPGGPPKGGGKPGGKPGGGPPKGKR